MSDDQALQQGAQHIMEIAWQSAQREGLPEGETRAKFMAQLAALVKQGAALLPLGNTVLLIKPLEKGTAEIHTFTTEDGRALVKRYVQAAQLAKQHGVKHIVSYADSPAFVKLAKSSGLPVKISQEPRMQGGQMRPMYRFDLDL